MKIQPQTNYAILASLLTAPVAMRSDYHRTLVLSLLRGEMRHPIARSEDERGGAEEDDYTPPWELPIYTASNGVAVLTIDGPLLKGYDACTCWFYGYASHDRIQDALREISARNDVAVVVLVVRSPGGMAMGTPETAAAVAALGKKKLCLAVTDTQACSAAYWIASQAATLFTTVSASVGCIGTYLALYDVTAYLDKEGFKLELFKEGKYKALGLAGNPLDENARALLTKDVARTNARFLEAVKAARSQVALEDMEGQWFDGEEAVQRGLADKIVASVDEVIAMAQQAVAGAMASPEVMREAI